MDDVKLARVFAKVDHKGQGMLDVDDVASLIFQMGHRVFPATVIDMW
jgi:hypothetical protein